MNSGSVSSISALYVIIIILYNNAILKCFAMSLACLYIKCPDCANYLDPVCASNGITYPNPCWIDCYNESLECEQKIEISRMGWCPMTMRPKRRSFSIPATTLLPSSPPEFICNISLCTCRSSYNPICGNNGVTYSNSCYFRCARRCFIDLEFVKCGLCSWTYPPTRLCLARTM